MARGGDERTVRSAHCAREHFSARHATVGRVDYSEVCATVYVTVKTDTVTILYA